MLTDPWEIRDAYGYVCDCRVFTDPKDSLCTFCHKRREEWEKEQEEEASDE